MKILHTSDWHLGKRLYQKELQEDHHLFFNWLVDTIKAENTDVVLVSGDIFDLANPSSEARKLYYNALKKISATGAQIVLTGGNHDSPAMLNAPRELLQALNITVVGELPENYSELIVPLGSETKPQVAVAAIPFIRDNELRRLAPGQSYEEREKAVREGIQEIFKESLAALKAQFPNAVPIAMGHLFAHGASTSDSERDIQVGNLAGFEASAFPSDFQYIALGHIHKPQSAGAEHILYSGSPIPLSFSEKADQKRILSIVIENENSKIESIPVPRWRQLIRFSGSLEKIKSALANFKNSTQLPAFIEVEMQEKTRNPSEIIALEKLVEDFNKSETNASIVKYFISISGQQKSGTQLFKQQQIEALKPGEVFGKWVEEAKVDQRTEKLLHEAFDEILQEYYQNEEA
ncbi:MAG: exonuclease subunit SbcD [Chitinophagales bacterium]